MRFDRVAPELRDAALALLLTGDVAPAPSAVARFLSYAEQISLDLTDLWVAHKGMELHGAALLVPSPGRAGMLFLPPARSRCSDDDLAQLVSTCLDHHSPGKTRLVQSLQDPGERHASAVLRAAGFERLAELVYMQRRGHAVPQPMELDPGITCVNYAEENRAYFERAILASYEQTQDCPALVGKRRIEDILAGHRGNGPFEPRLWLALHDDEKPVGVMLINRVTGRSTGELVYLGLSPAYRGRGIARQLLHHGLGLATEAGCTSMILAVDQDNASARTLYRKTGFVPTGRKHAWIRFLPDQA